MTTPSPSAPPIVWAVWLGCDTAHKLAREWGISKSTAARKLVDGVRDGWLDRVKRGVYRVPVVEARTGARWCGIGG